MALQQEFSMASSPGYSYTYDPAQEYINELNLLDSGGSYSYDYLPGMEAAGGLDGLYASGSGLLGSLGDIGLGGVALAFGYGSCDFTYVPPPPPDPHTLKPESCSSACHSPRQPGRLADGKEIGKTIIGKAAQIAAAAGSEFTPQINIDPTLLRNGLLAGAAGLTTAAVCMVTDCQIQDDNSNRGDRCNTGAGFTGINIVYLPRHEQAGECVASGAFGALTQDDYTAPPRPKLGFDLPGLDSLPGDNRARGHLIGFAMGGSNKDTRNFVAMYQVANQWMYEHAEDPVVRSLQAGGNVFVDVMPVYGDAASPMPTGIEYLTYGTVTERCYIANTADAAGSHCYN